MACFFNLKADIIETSKIDSVQDHILYNTFVMFNITDTLYQPANTLSSQRWREFLSERIHVLIPNQISADKLANKWKGEIVRKIPKKPVEASTAGLIEQLQARQIPVYGITRKQMVTSYAQNFGEITKNHLLSLGIDFAKTNAYAEIPAGDEKGGFSFAWGIVFSNKKTIGEALTSFIKNLRKPPTKIVMIDNSRNSLVEAEKTCSCLGINFVGLRYCRNDSIQDSFDPVLGIIEFISFVKEGVILSDVQASNIKAANPGNDYHKVFEALLLSMH